MNLFYTVGSPFARVVRVALLETGLDASVTKQEIPRSKLYSTESDVLPLNPIGRVPTLKLADGTILTESKLILDYIDALNPGRKLSQLVGSDGWRMLAEAGQAWGLLEGTVTWLRASQQPEPQRTASTIAWEATRVGRATDALEIAVSKGAYAGPINAGQIVLGVALGFADARLAAWKWREGHMALAAWYDAIVARPSFQSTMPPPM
jgi:glutathione S-transferase